MGHTFSRTITFAVGSEVVRNAIVAVESYPEWVEGVREVAVLERDDEQLPRRAQFTIDTPLAPISYTLAYDYPHIDEITWTLVEGQMLSQLDGQYTLEANGGSTTLHATFEISVDMPLPSIVIRQAGQTIVDRAVAGLERRLGQAAS